MERLDLRFLFKHGKNIGECRFDADLETALIDIKFRRMVVRPGAQRFIFHAGEGEKARVGGLGDGKGLRSHPCLP